MKDCKRIIELLQGGSEFRTVDLLILNQINRVIYLMTTPVITDSEKAPLTAVFLYGFPMIFGHLSRRCARAQGTAGANSSKRILWHKSFVSFKKENISLERRTIDKIDTLIFVVGFLLRLMVLFQVRRTRAGKRLPIFRLTNTTWGYCAFF